MSLSTTFARGQSASWQLYAVGALVVCAGAVICMTLRAPGGRSSQPAMADRGVRAASPNAYGHAVTNLVDEHWKDLRDGKDIFVTTWVAPGDATAQRAMRGPSASVRDGLGPTFNATSCTSCHFRDGRGGPRARPSQPTEPAQPATPRLLRLGLVGLDGQFLAEPTYGTQLQDHAVSPAVPEGAFEIDIRSVEGRYPDGDRFVMESPVVTLRGLSRGALHPQARTSVRLPPSLIGLGLLEAVAEQTISASADPDDGDGDGISGRASHVRDPQTGELALGRFGWKASQPSLRLQNAMALREDLGVTTTVFPEARCPTGDTSCATASGAAPELDAAGLEQLTRYTRLLGPPARRNARDAEVMRGEALFAVTGCAGCHRPRLVTGEVSDLPELARQTIEPYSDLLLHDMGEPLADHRPEGDASGQEWRTAPLWGLGSLRVVSGEVRLLHDGRARSPEQAILWHDGEAAAARNRFMRLPRNDRAALLRFVDSL